MNYYLLSEQDLDELAWEIEDFLSELRVKIEDKKVKEDPESRDENKDFKEESEL